METGTQRGGNKNSIICQRHKAQFGFTNSTKKMCVKKDKR